MDVSPFKFLIMEKEFVDYRMNCVSHRFWEIRGGDDAMRIMVKLLTIACELSLHVSSLQDLVKFICV